jgi:hypothetical protein
LRKEGIRNSHPTNQTHPRQALPNKNQKQPSLQGAVRFFAHCCLELHSKFKIEGSHATASNIQGAIRKKITLSETEVASLVQSITSGCARLPLVPCLTFQSPLHTLSCFPLHTARRPAPLPTATMNGGGRRRYSSEQLLFDVPSNAGAGRWAQQVRPPAHRDLRGVRVFWFLGDGLIARMSLCAARRGAARGREDLRVGGALHAHATAGRGRRSGRIARTEATAQPWAARSPRLGHRANP